MIKQYQQSNVFILYDDALIDEPLSQLFEPIFWQAQHKVVGSAVGRGTTWFVQLEQIQGALRHYYRGGLFGKLVDDLYWFTGWEQSRSCEEFHLLHVLREAEVNVPRPVAARVVKQGMFYRADLLSERIPDAADLVSILRKQSISAAQYQKIGAEIARMHCAGVNHTDLNIHNILLDAQQNVWIIDFDKCTQASGDGGWRSDNLSRLKRSFNKELLKHQIHWEETEFEFLLQGYR